MDASVEVLWSGCYLGKELSYPIYLPFYPTDGREDMSTGTIIICWYFWVKGHEYLAFELHIIIWSRGRST